MLSVQLFFVFDVPRFDAKCGTKTVAQTGLVASLQHCNPLFYYAPVFVSTPHAQHVITTDFDVLMMGLYSPPPRR